MFRKDVVVKSKTLLKKSDKRNLLEQLNQSFTTATQNDIGILMSVKDEVYIIKVKTSSEALVNVYSVKCSEGIVPMFFTVEKLIFPTVYALWKCPNLIPSVSVHPGVTDWLKGGADLMLPGIDRTNGFMTFETGQMCAVRESFSLSAMAVGLASINSVDISTKKTGKAVIINHTYTDHLWEMGPQTKPPHIPNPQVIALDDVANQVDELVIHDAGVEAGVEGGVENEAGNEEGVDQAKGEQAAAVDVVNQENAMDELLLQCFLCALKKDGKRLELPLLASDFYKNYMIAYCPETIRLDIKKSSYKKFKTFLLAMQDLKIIKVNCVTQSILSVDMEHEQIEQFRIPDILSKSRKVAGAPADIIMTSSFTPPDVNIVYLATSQVMQLLRCEKKQAFTKTQVNQAILNYAKDNDLQNKENITIDPFLGSVILGRYENTDILHIKDVVERVLNKMSAGFEFVFDGKKEIHNGRPKIIEIDKKRKAANKIVTSVKNLSFFMLDINQIAFDLKRDLSSSVSKADDILSVQGDHQNAIKKHLKERYNMPERYIDVK